MKVVPIHFINTFCGKSEQFESSLIILGAAGYAHIEEKASSTNPRMSQIQVLGIAPQASVETLDSFTSGPPVPDKNFVVSDSEVELASAITPQEGASPNLPPRNGDRYDNFILLRQTIVIFGPKSAQTNITWAQKHLIFWPLT